MAVLSLVELSTENLEVLERFLDMTCRSLLETLRTLTDASASVLPHTCIQRCYRIACKQQFQQFGDKCTWHLSLRALKSDNQQYEFDTTATFLVRNEGRYWFSILQAKRSQTWCYMKSNRR
ncbi:unnamed protein product [Peronospora destructor]|uniref:Uncharacterized protein n=1 Tax=Peronospora destructor TaxID=86335 RepID=A0AAV0UM70_9STRA|nr:unnamed protein product [Peronospora destructor]